jgi:diguanylate cyclase (GGDEF)-like protein
VPSARRIEFEGVDLLPAAALALIADLQAEVARLTDQLRNLADHDPLTDLLNPATFEEEVEGQVALDARYGHRTSLVLLEVVGLDGLRETGGQAAADDSLVAVADRIRGRLRETDRAARLDGGRFAVLLPLTDEAGARTVGSALAAVASEPPDPASPTPPVTVRVGITSLRHPDTLDGAVARAGVSTLDVGAGAPRVESDDLDPDASLGHAV